MRLNPNRAWNPVKVFASLHRTAPARADLQSVCCLLHYARYELQIRASEERNCTQYGLSLPANGHAKIRIITLTPISPNRLLAEVHFLFPYLLSILF